ncbi:TIGR03982 family His-Xaa-Ser system protein [Aquibium sp. LZ166]|uniref:TIGR03982 family His-Xaa-Ser system protein n=1 Tax=Aquibium pacificus TaxID=3153579 RepID=A0ABV3SKN0_9HYPH
MRSRSWLSRTGYLIAFLAGITTAIVALPLWKLALIRTSQSSYGELTFACDHAMRGHLIAKMSVAKTPSEDTVRELKAAEIQLIACQDYDLMRKRLIRWGLTDNELSEMALLAIEERATNLQEVVRVHEIRY